MDAVGKPVAGLPKLPAFFAEAFQLGPEAEPQIIDSDTGLIVLKVTEIKAAVLKPLDSVRADVVAALLQRARAEAADQHARQIAERLRAGGDLAKEAAALGVTVQLSAPLTRGQNAERSFSPVIVGALFNAKPGEVVTGPAAMPGPSGGADAIVARLIRVEPADTAAIARQQDQTAQQLAGGIAQDLLQQYRQKLEKDIGVSVNVAARTRAISSGQ
jgi:peptidyl-prolyl cis-trans isomerase D